MDRNSVETHLTRWRTKNDCFFDPLELWYLGRPRFWSSSMLLGPRFRALLDNMNVQMGEKASVERSSRVDGTAPSSSQLWIDADLT